MAKTVHIQTVCFKGINAHPVDVQIQISSGIPSFSIVGLADKAVSESRERVKAAMHSVGIGFPMKKIVINLSPANIKKEGSHYDLAIAVSLLVATGALPQDLCDYVCIGELLLDGSIVHVRGALSSAVYAMETGKKLLCPYSCAGEAAWAGGIEILAPAHLHDLMNHFKGEQLIHQQTGQIQDLCESYGDFSDIKGQEQAKRLIEIAACGGHNVLLSGPPGAGKSMLASRMISILPPLSPKEALESTMIHSLSNYGSSGKLLRYRPFRRPHHSSSMVSIIGGGMNSLPGEVSLAHGGILFLDEFPELSRMALESLREPLETGEVTIARANCHITYPSMFQLVAAMNPCRCGYFGTDGRECHQAPLCAENYRKKISGPIFDRIDLFMNVPSIQISKIQDISDGDKSEIVAKRVATTQVIQHKRHKSSGLASLNARVPSGIFESTLRCEDDAKALLIKASDKFFISMRGYQKVMRVARTIADMDFSTAINKKHVAEALSYRSIH